MVKIRRNVWESLAINGGWPSHNKTGSIKHQRTQTGIKIIQRMKTDL